ncbi:MAG: hypothetical protein AB8B65_17435, partial [Kordia sp.]|uniref:hypothetical protein n=1 Tax=Kordia sp. TaxID=1965332 RepID=UPI00385F2113
KTVGYMQLLMQEQGIISSDTLSEKEILRKDYIKKYKEYKLKLKDYEELDIPSNIPSWGIMISRLNNNFFQKHKKRPADKLDNILQSTNKSKFVFSVPDEHYHSIKINKYDSQFFKKIIWELYGESFNTLTKERNKSSLSKRLQRFLYSPLFLMNFNSKKFIDDYEIDKNYLVSGWKYPKKITQIAFTSITFIFIYFCYILRSNYEFIEWNSIVTKNISLPLQEVLPCVLFIISVSFYLVWLTRYVLNLKLLVYGKHSIDSYCWNFFLFRVQLLNSKGIIPIFFSRSFLRFFKTNLLIRQYEGYDIKNNIFSDNKKITSKVIKEYWKKLTNYQRFTTEERLEIHKEIVKHYKKLRESNSLSS